MAKFKVGDVVKGNHPIFAKGKIGIVEEVDEIDDELPYRVDFIGETDYWIEEKFLELVEGKKITGNKVIDLLMKELGVEIDEEFEIIGSIYNPYKITEKGYLIDRDGDERTDPLVWLILGQREIRKIPKPEIKKIPKPEIKKIPKPEIKEMTVAELEEALKLPKGTLRVKGDQQDD